jgi:hypothetical protein
MMTQRLYDSCILAPIDLTTDCSTKNGPAPNRWRLKVEDYSAARRALYAAKAQLV